LLIKKMTRACVRVCVSIARGGSAHLLLSLCDVVVSRLLAVVVVVVVAVVVVVLAALGCFAALFLPADTHTHTHSPPTVR